MDKRAPDGFPGLLFILPDVLRATLDALRRELWTLFAGSMIMVCPGHYLDMDSDECGRCPWRGKCGR